MANAQPDSSYLKLLNDGEPFRLLFPLGTLLGVTGLAVWPLWQWGILEPYPAQIHSRIMIEGFLTAFALGFLGTALPRLVDAKGFHAGHTLLAAVLLLAASGLHLLQLHLWADAVTLLLMAGFAGMALERFEDRKDLPPPAFVLVGGGWLCAITGISLQIAIQLAAPLPAVLVPLARLLLNQGFVLLLVMGAGAFFMPRFFNLPSRQTFPEALQPDRKWIGRALFAAGAGLLVIVSLVAEAIGWVRAGPAVRAVVVAAFLLREVPVLRQNQPGGSLATAVRIVLLALPLGFLFTAFFPAYQIGLLHIVFVTGFGLLVFSVATWVMLGHSGRRNLCAGRHPTVRLLAAGMLVAALTRVSADLFPDSRYLHYTVAALAWILCVIPWAVRFLPAVTRPDNT